MADFFENSRIPAGCKFSFITLILKVSSSVVVNDFRHISLIFVRYKILAYEVVEWYKKKEKKIDDSKIDFVKAYDSTSWEYLDCVMLFLNFGSK